MRRDCAVKAWSRRHFARILGPHLAGGDARVTLRVLQRQRLHRVHLRRRLCVARHVHRQAIVDVAGLRAQALLEARPGIRAPRRCAGAAIAAVKFADEMAPYIGCE